METQQAPRLGCGVLAGALAASVVLAFIFGSLWPFALPFVFVLVLAFGGAVGLALHAFAQGLGQANWFTAGLAGLLVGLLCTLIIQDEPPIHMLWFGGAGLVGGLTFWAAAYHSADFD